ncbi:Unknown protein sequence [Pseudomonas amygdali pv. lachrymans]|nr:Unknown protein sequence [Pseudomonas amygdali pv. lachrymans]
MRVVVGEVHIQWVAEPLSECIFLGAQNLPLCSSIQAVAPSGGFNYDDARSYKARVCLIIE